jgi:hypothetical protein
MLARFRRGATKTPPWPAGARPGTAEGAFRFVVEERLASMQRQLDEVKARVNGLLFLLAGAVASEFIMRLVT